MALSKVLGALVAFVVFLGAILLFSLFLLSPLLFYGDMEAALEVAKLVFLLSWGLSSCLTAVFVMDEQYTSVIEEFKMAAEANLTKENHCESK